MTTDQKRAYAVQFSVHVGVDTAKTFHKLVARGPDGHRTKAYKVLVSRAGFEAADEYLRGFCPGVAPQQILLGLEFTWPPRLHVRAYRISGPMPKRCGMWCCVRRSGL